MSTPAITQDAAVAPLPVHKRRWFRIARNVVLGIVATLFLIWLVLYITKGRFLKHPFESITTKLVGRPVKVQGDFQLYFAPLQIKFYAEGLSVANPQWATKPNLFQAQKVDTRIAPLSLIFGKRRLYWLDLTGGAIDLEWNAAHTTNTWTFADTGGKPFEIPRIDRATVAGTTVRYIDPQMRLATDLAIDTVTALDKTIGKAVGLRGTGRIRDTPFRVVAQLLSPDATVNRGENKLTLRAWAANNVIDVAGTLPSATDVEDVQLRTRAQGRNLAELLAIIGVVLPNTRGYDLRAEMVKDGPEYRFTHLAGRFGNSDLAGRLTVTNGERLRLDSVLATRSLDIVDAAPFIGYNPDIVATKGAMAAAAATGAGPTRIMPDAALPVAELQRFDAGLKWTIGDIKSKNVPVSNVDLTLSLDHGKLALSPLTFAMARGNVASDIVFDTRARPAADSYDIRLSPTPMGRLLAGYGVDESGTSGTIKGRIQLAGRGDTIHDSLASATGRIAFVMPSGSFWTRNVQLSELDIGTFIQKMFEHKLKEPVQINCGLIGFTVRDGIAAADPILIDTQKNVILGRGGFSFKNESLDMAFRADGKKFSIFSGQSPVGLNGYFAKPGIDVISPELVGRAGAGIGLGVVASPLAAILAFVDIGDAKSAQCGPVLAGAHAAAMRTKGGKPRDDVGNGTTSKTESGKESPAVKQKQKKKFLGIF
ncbi:AsmA family protein [Sphingomonas panacisoli]|uniref:AsmA family protein n=1 Tax=Sphingomonas panacisoli TaxID=1813879 RepID=A0A5B8LL84_9SPHN|nr:AsmA family protein [Sphingomonas panacisoli]QDZ08967.1 AsmA family protein [Sphingomonas panacisoli]